MPHLPRLGHPRRVELEAWFDGEGEQDVGQHVSACARCRGHLDEVARLRMWLRGDLPAGVARSASGGRASRSVPNLGALSAAMVVVVVAAMTFVLPSTARLRLESGPPPATRPEGRFPGPDQVDAPPAEEIAGGETADSSTGEPSAASTPEPAAGARASGPSRTSGGAPLRGGSSPAGSTAAAGAGSSTPAGPLAASVPVGVRLGLVVPRSGPAAREGAEIERVVRLRIDLANAVGGVNGWRVGLEVAPAEDDAAVRKLIERIDALVGGFGLSTPPEGLTVPWLLPADPAIEGPTVVRAEPTPRRAGERLADQLRAEGAAGAVGVVVDGTADAALADGLGANVVRATATGSNCDNEIATLRQRNVTTVAVAAAPAWVTRCIESLEAAKFRPANGLLVAPSAAYATSSERSASAGARSVLGLPWPTAPDSGGARFRLSAGSTSYRALVSFAAVELAVDSARSAAGKVGLTAGQRVLTDLIHVTDNGNDQTLLVVAGVTGWLPASSRR